MSEIGCLAVIGRLHNLTLRIDGAGEWSVDKTLVDDLQNDVTYLLPCIQMCLLGNNEEADAIDIVTLVHGISTV